MTINSHRKQDGFTLVELVIALFLLAVGLIAMAGLQVTAIKEDGLSRNLITALFSAEKKMEEFKNTSFSTLTNVTNQGDANNPLTVTGQTGGIYDRYWTIQDYSGSPNMKQITVLVSWMERGRSRSVSIDTVVSK